MTLDAEQLTEKWLTDWVIKLDLCPFAKYPYQHNKIKIIATDETNEDAVFRFVLNEMEQLYQTPAEKLETTLVVVERLLIHFDEYLDFLELLEKVLQETGLEGILQIASFHPVYRFEGEEVDDPANYTNRSPYPMFHLIREKSLEAALAHYESPENIPKRNIALLREMGVKQIRQMLDGVAARRGRHQYQLRRLSLAGDLYRIEVCRNHPQRCCF